jgi:hypothetical protein
MIHWIPIALLLPLSLTAWSSSRPAIVEFTGGISQSWNLAAGQTVEILVGLPAPSELPPNGRIAVQWGDYRKVIHALDPDFYMVYRAPASGTYTLAHRS